MSIGLGVTKVITVAAANLNSAADTALLTYWASKPLKLIRFGVVADAAAGLLAPMRLKLRRVPVKTGTAADIAEAGTLDPGGARARGILVTKTVLGPTDKVTVQAGDAVVLAVAVAAGGVSTGNVWIEFEELPFSGTLVPADAVKSA